MIKVRTAEALKDHRLALTFSDGTSGIVDLSEHTKRKPFRALQDERVFRRTAVENGAVEWPDGDVGIATEALYALAHGLKKPETLADAFRNELHMSLRELRRVAGLTQVDAANALDWDQGQLSRFERQEDMRVSSLREYVVGVLGGELEVIAVLGDKRIAIRGI